MQQDGCTGPGDDGLVMRLGVAGFAMMNVMLLSVAVWSGASDSTRDLFHWIREGRPPVVGVGETARVVA